MGKKQNKKQLDSAPPGTVGEGEETREADSNKQTKKKTKKLLQDYEK